METAFELLPVAAAALIVHIARYYSGRFNPYSLFIMMCIAAGVFINLISAEGREYLPVDISITLASGIMFWIMEAHLLKKIYGR